MSNPFSLYKSETSDYINDAFIKRIVSGFSRADGFSNVTALLAPVTAPRSAIINLCREQANRTTNSQDNRKLFWIEPFRAWDMFTMGNLSLALLWHLYCSMPKEAIADDKIIYKLGKISVTLPALTEGLKKSGSGYGHDPDRHNAITTKAFPTDRKSSVSSIFSACEQITELSEAFRSIGKQIATAGNFDTMIIPVVDIDQCLPEQAISLLFAIRNFISCESISFLIATDDGILSRFLISLYDNSLTADMAHSTLLSLFDDWVYLPPPHLKNMIQHIDKNIGAKECDYIICKINACGILAAFTDYSRLHHAFNRFNLFKKGVLQQHSIEELTLYLILFLYGTLDGGALRSLAIRPDLEQWIASIRTNEHRGSSSGSNAKQTTSSMPSAGNSQLDVIIRTVPTSLSGTEIARQIVQILPFI